AAGGGGRDDDHPCQPLQHSPPPCFRPRGDLFGIRPWGRPSSLTSLFVKCCRTRSRWTAAIAFGGGVRQGPARGRRRVPRPPDRGKCKIRPSRESLRDDGRRARPVPTKTSPRLSCVPRPYWSCLDTPEVVRRSALGPGGRSFLVRR